MEIFLERQAVLCSGIIIQEDNEQKLQRVRELFST